MSTDFRNWDDLREEIKRLFFNSIFIKNPEGVYRSLIDIVNNIEKNQELYLRSQDHLNGLLLGKHKDIMEFWMGYLAGAKVQLLLINFINSAGEKISNEEMIEIHKNDGENFKLRNDIFIVIELNEKKVKELSS